MDSSPADAVKSDRPDAGGDPYRELFERSADAILIIENETFVDCNQATVDMLRYRDKQELLQTHPADLSPPLQADGCPSFAKANEMIALALARGSHRFEWLHRRADGEIFPVEVLLTAVPGRDRPRLHVVWRDITERKRLETELRQAQKIEAIGKLAGGIAHDFNNLLVSILGHAELLAGALADQADLLEQVAEIKHAGERAAELVGQLLAFGRKQDLQPQVIDLNALLRDLTRLLVRVIGERIEVELRLAPDDLCVKADPAQLEQVVLNLATNARDAMPGGGVLTLATSLADESGAVNGAASRLEAGRYVVLEVRDTGEGISPDVLERIFDPFFTTKELGKGTGLGLSSVYGIIRQSGGDVTVESEVGVGTVFRIFLPSTDETPLAAAPTSPVERRADAHETILLVEDEASVASLVERVLSREGYTVLRARDGAEALAVARSRHFDLLVTDMVMPRLGGRELARALLAERPQLCVLYTSGYTDSSLAEGLDAGEDLDLIQKPFTPRELLSRVRSALDRRRAG
ncbi:MAG TPA: ATP-binding protein [Candidatus Krumholzibacteria bacterium]|nr:ATP-binding protein [Candidatus Krumholzibacteria bacterium]HPD73129.1 ATP-binding protein [Candidatus Krumholzibacteria bacterium]HRY41993.1 ATP-binding protein [Candidatus Krumholzibacteria bacterium]